MSASMLASLLSIVAVITGASTGMAVHLLGRRQASGRVNTSEASVLWQQAQDMRAQLIAEKTRTEEQRDLLIASYTDQVLPMLTSINKLVRDLAAANSESIATIRANTETIQQTRRIAEVNAIALRDIAAGAQVIREAMADDVALQDP